MSVCKGPGPTPAASAGQARREPEEIGLKPLIQSGRLRGRGAVSNPGGRYEPTQHAPCDDGWGSLDEPPPVRTEVTLEKARVIITRNDSPDIPFDRSLNPYRGCEHGCVYCFARPTHAYQGLSPGLDFETKLFAKPNAAELLEKELSASGYRPRVIAMGTNTDPYQPIERTLRITRGVLEVLNRFSHPVGLVTKSGLVTRDLDILAPMAARSLVRVAVSVTTLDPKLARTMEPRAAAPAKRLATLRQLAAAGVPAAVMVAPVIPVLNDHEIERILEAAAEAGARSAGYVLLRLPHELTDLVRDCLTEHYPDKLNHVFSIVRDARGGKDNDSTWGRRMTGTGPYAQMIGRRFEAACRRLGLNERRAPLRTDLFAPPARVGGIEQLSLF